MKLSEMKSSPDVGRPERTFPICVSGKLVAELEAADKVMFEVDEEYQAAREAREEALAERERRRGDGGETRPTRLGQRPDVPAIDPDLERRFEEAAAASDAVRERMNDHTITLALRAWSNGYWRQWVTMHPTRDEDADPVGYDRDRKWAAGFCNIDALITDLGSASPSGDRLITRYGDEAPTDESWTFVADNAAPGDLTRLASLVVGMHEQVVDLGKSRADWLGSRRTAPDSE